MKKDISPGRPGFRASLTLIPPPPVSDRIVLDVRGAVYNDGRGRASFEVTFHLDRDEPVGLLHRAELEIGPGNCEGVSFRWPTEGRAGSRTVIMTVRSEGRTVCASRPLEIIPSGQRSVGRIDGAWTGFYHWSEQEGRLWNAEIRTLTDAQWGELVRAMHEIGMNVIVIQELFRHQMYAGKHAIETEGYSGRAFYPSRLFPGRMDELAARDPVEAILAEADRHGMHVLMGVGLYAWFDFTPGSLRWHRRVASEVWELYGHHPSFFGFYVSEEAPGSLDNWESDPTDAGRRRRELVDFFRDFGRHCRSMAPDKPIMLATNCHRVPAGLDAYPELLAHLDILCPFGFARMPEGDLTGEAAADLLQRLCDAAGSHLWLDMEVFLFDETGALYPRPIEGVISDLRRFPNFEKILCYQFPGLMNAPWMTCRPGGAATVRLYEDYRRFLAVDAAGACTR